MSTRTYRAGAFMAAAQRAGVPVVVASERAQALSPMNPAGHLTLDLADPASVGALAALARERPVGAVVAADDDGALLAARASAALGLRHHPPDAVAAALDKRRTRQAFRFAGLPAPEFETVPLDGDPAHAAARVGFPCVVKPLTLSASRGVIRADDPAALASAFARAAAIVRAAPGAPPELLIERYVPGVEVALEGLVEGGVLAPLALFDKPDPLEGPFFEETIYVTPSRLEPALQQAVLATAARAAAALGLSDGPVHAELRIDAGLVWPLEIAPRSIGGLCSRALRFTGDRTLEDVLLAHALGRSGRPAREPGASGVMMIPIPRAGTLRGVRGLDSARGVGHVEDVRITIPHGQRLVPLPEGASYLGFIFARASAPDAVERALRRAHRLLEFDIEAGDAESVTRGVDS